MSPSTARRRLAINRGMSSYEFSSVFSVTCSVGTRQGPPLSCPYRTSDREAYERQRGILAGAFVSVRKLGKRDRGREACSVGRH